MKLQTVNILELEGGNFVALRSFTDDVEGNKEAETYFLQVVTNLNNGIPATEEVNNALIEDGHYENGDYQVLITHSVSPEGNTEDTVEWYNYNCDVKRRK